MPHQLRRGVVRDGATKHEIDSILTGLAVTAEKLDHSKRDASTRIGTSLDGSVELGADILVSPHAGSFCGNRR